MADKVYQPIHDSKEYREFIADARDKIPKMFNSGVKRTTVDVPSTIVARIDKSIDVAMVYEQLRGRVESALEDLCIVSNWYHGKDHHGNNVIRFAALKEILRDEA